MPIEPDQSRQYKEANSKKNEKNNKIYYIYGKLDYFIKNCCSNNKVKEKQINATLKNNLKVWKDIEKKIIAMDKHTLKSSLDDKYFYIQSWENLLTVLNKKQSTWIFDLQN